MAPVVKPHSSICSRLLQGDGAQQGGAMGREEYGASGSPMRGNMGGMAPSPEPHHSVRSWQWGATRSQLEPEPTGWVCQKVVLMDLL